MSCCPTAYSDYGGSHTGKGFYVGTHYMRHATFSPLSSSQVTWPALVKVWEGNNVLFGDGHVAWVAGQATHAPSADGSLGGSSKHPGEYVVKKIGYKKGGWIVTAWVIRAGELDF